MVWSRLRPPPAPPPGRPAPPSVRELVVDRPASWLVPNGFGFIVPYVAVYLLGRAFDLPTSGLRVVFIALHAITLVGLAAWAWPRLRRADPRMVGFWLVLGALFLLPGAYLEFPSDAWEHVRRIYAWNTAARVNDHDTAGKFAYFWGWTWLGAVPIGWRPVALAVYGAFWQLVLAGQFYRLARALGFSRGWSVAQVAGTVALFGTNLFAFYRYYALASTPLAYVAYLHGVVAVLEGARAPRWRRAASVALAAVVAWANHDQELLFLAVTVPVLLAFDWASRRSPGGRIVAGAATAVLILGSLGLGSWLVARHPDLYRGHLGAISAMGTYRLWDPHAALFETLGLHGVVGLAAACLIARARPRLAILTLLPVALLSVPPFVVFTALAFPDSYIVYRVLYACPASLALVGAIETLTTLVALRATLALGLAGMSLVPAWPVRGRLHFQLYVPPAANRLTHVYPVAAELARLAAIPGDCVVVSDGATHFFVASHLGLRPGLGRIVPDNLFERWAVSPSPDQVADPSGQVLLPVCAAVLFRPEEVPASPGSPVARRSGHWAERRSNPRTYTRADLSTFRTRLRDAGWVPVGAASWINPRVLRSPPPRQVGAGPER